MIGVLDVLLVNVIMGWGVIAVEREDWEECVVRMVSSWEKTNNCSFEGSDDDDEDGGFNVDGIFNDGETFEERAARW